MTDPASAFAKMVPGKTTLIRMLATVLRPTSGEAEVCGHPVSHPNQITPLIGYMSQKFCMYPDLSVAENLEFFGTVRGVSKADRAERSERLLVGMGLERFTARQAQFLSGGMKQKLMLAPDLDAAQVDFAAHLQPVERLLLEIDGVVVEVSTRARALEPHKGPGQRQQQRNHRQTDVGVFSFSFHGYRLRQPLHEPKNSP